MKMESTNYVWQYLRPPLVFDTHGAKFTDSYLNLDQFQSYREPIDVSPYMSFFGAESGTLEHNGNSPDQATSPWLNSPSSSEQSSSADYCHLRPHSRERALSSLSGEVTYLNMNSHDNAMSGGSSIPGEYYLELDDHFVSNHYCLPNKEVELPGSIYQGYTPVFNNLSHPSSSGFVRDETQFQVNKLSDPTLELEVNGACYSSENDSFSPASTSSYYSSAEFGEWNRENTSRIDNIFTSPNGKVYLNSAPVHESEVNIRSSYEEDPGAIHDELSKKKELSSESQEAPKKSRRKNRKTKVFYESLSPEERKNREHEMEKERARKYRMKEKDKFQNITKTLKLEEELRQKLTEEKLNLASQINSYKKFLRFNTGLIHNA